MIELPSPALIGVIHLLPLPGSPRHLVSMDEILDRALLDAKTLQRSGFDAVIIENLGDAPFHPQSISPASVAAMAIIADHVRRELPVKIGINALRNDARAAMGIAAAVGASFIRVNVHSGVYATDQGIIEGRADETLRYRKSLGQKIAILADVHVKHATPMHELDIARAAKDTAYRGLADGLIVTGSSTGDPVNPEQLLRVHEAVPDRKIFIGSGATADNIASLLKNANGVIVGTGIKKNADPSNPIDESLSQAFVEAAGRGS